MVSCFKMGKRTSALTCLVVADALADVSNVSLLNSFVCAEILFGDLDEQRYCVAQTTSIVSSIETAPTARPSAYCVLPSEWMCNSRTDSCTWYNGACRSKSFCQVSQSSDCQTLVDVHGHGCLWEVKLPNPTKKPSAKKRKRRKRGLREEEEEEEVEEEGNDDESDEEKALEEGRDLQTIGVCSSTVTPRNPKDYCPE